MKISSLFLLSILFSFSTMAQLAPTVDDLFRKPDIRSVKLSPDGQWLAYIKQADDRRDSLITVNLATNETHGFRGGDEQDLYDYYWLNDDWLVFQVSEDNKYALGIFAVKKDDPSKTLLLDAYNVTRIVDMCESDPEKLWGYVQSDFKNEKNSSLKLYDMNGSFNKSTGAQFGQSTEVGKVARRIDCQPNGYALNWWFTTADQPAIALVFDSKNDDLCYYRIPENPKNDWEKMGIDPEDWSILSVIENNEAYVSGYKNGQTIGLYKMNLETEEVGERLFNDPVYDVDPLLVFEDNSTKLLGLTYQGKLPRSVWLDPTLQGVQKSLRTLLPKKINSIGSFVTSAKRYVIHSSTPSRPPDYYLLDLNTQKLQRIGNSFPWLEEKNMSKVKRFNFESDDGLTLEAYFTFPYGKEPQKLPLVVLSHGGPWVRDYWSFDQEAQFLAGQGYAVLQVNYRGSSGYGKEISDNQAFEFTSMMEDVNKGVDYVIQKGWVDSQRISLMGASFGGYASAYLAALYPNKFKCAIATVGVYDLEEHVSFLKSEFKAGGAAYSFWREKIGDPKLDKTHLRSISPMYMCDKIKIPFLITHGKKDAVVSFKQSNRFAKELEKNDVPVTKIIDRKSGHGFFHEENRKEYYENVITFLDKHL